MEHPLHDYIAGALGGSTGLIIGHPFDTTKVQLQTQQHGDQYSGTWDAIKHIKTKGWVRGFFRGMAWPLFSYGLVNSVFFGVYGNTLKLIQSDRTKRKTSYWHIYIAGCAGGAAQTIVACPIDFVKVVLQSQIQHHEIERPASRHLKQEVSKKFYRGPLECFLDIYKKNGVKGVYKGGVILAWRDVPSFGVYCLVYESLTDKMHNMGLTDSNGIVASLFSGGMAGMITWFLVMPFDVIKSRIQADFSNEYSGAIDCAIKSYKEEGISVFYRSTLITCLRAFPVNAATFLVYSQTMKYLEHSKQPVEVHGDVSHRL
ncbi:hypothetical protein ScPMuIL_014419 [Solemya velum]